MKFGINDNVISEFLSGVIIILALMMVGALLAFLLKRMEKHYPFSRLAIILALTPLSLMHFLDRETQSFFFLYAMIIALMGITIDGIKHLFEFRTKSRAYSRLEISGEQADVSAEASEEAEASDEAEDLGPGVLVWEKAK